MKSNNCTQFNNEIWLFIDGELSTDRMNQWKEHISSCGKCSSKLKTSEETLLLYENLPLEDIDNETYIKIINTATTTFPSFTKKNMPQYNLRGRSLSEIFGFYKLAFGGGLLVAAIILVFISLFNDPKIPAITEKIPLELLQWDGPRLSDRTTAFGDGIISLQTDNWEIYIVKKNSTEEWNTALRAIQKQIIKMKMEVNKTSM